MNAWGSNRRPLAGGRGALEGEMERISISDGGESLKVGQCGMYGVRNRRLYVEKVQSVSDSFSQV